MTDIGTIDLVNGGTRERSGQIAVHRDGAVVVLTIEKHHTVTLRLPPTLARRMAELLSEAAGPARPTLSVVKP